MWEADDSAEPTFRYVEPPPARDSNTSENVEASGENDVASTALDMSSVVALASRIQSRLTSFDLGVFQYFVVIDFEATCDADTPP